VAFNILLRFAALLIVFTLVFSPDAGAHHCKGKHANDPGCDPGGGGGGGGGEGPAADPAFVYVQAANGANKLFLANADGSAATEIFVGTKFSFTQQPALYGGPSGGQVLVNDYSNLHLITYSVNSGVINVDSDVKIQDRDNGPTTHTSNPDWSPDGSDFAYKSTGGMVFLGSRATYHADGYMVDFGDPIYAEERGTGNRFVTAIAWDHADTIHLTMDNPVEDGYELRSVNLSDCNPTCDSMSSLCIASTNGSSDCPANAPVLGVGRLQHVSVSDGTNCTMGTSPHIFTTGRDANGDPVTFVLDGSMPFLTIQDFEGTDWTPNCTIVGTPGEGISGQPRGRSIVERNPYTSNVTTLIGSKAQWADWNN
jgi:hypothetical protein